MKIGMHIILSVLTAWLEMHPYLKGNLRETWARTMGMYLARIQTDCIACSQLQTFL